MIDSNTLFYLVLVALILITICLFTIVYLMIEDEKKNKLKAKTSSVAESKATQKCLHFLGYLAVEHPRKQPIPKECFGCTLALECIQKNIEENIVKVKVAQT